MSLWNLNSYMRELFYSGQKSLISCGFLFLNEIQGYLEPFESYDLEIKNLWDKNLIYIEIRTFVFIKMPKYSIWMAISELSLDGLNFLHLSYFVVLIQKCACKVRCVLRCPYPLVYTKLIAVNGETTNSAWLAWKSKVSDLGTFLLESLKSID